MTGVIEKAVCGVAKATNHEILCCMNKIRQLDVKLSSFNTSIHGKVEKEMLAPRRISGDCKCRM